MSRTFGDLRNPVDLLAAPPNQDDAEWDGEGEKPVDPAVGKAAARAALYPNPSNDAAHAQRTPGGGQGAPSGGAAPSEGYESLTVAELRAELDARGLAAPSDARKADLVDALEADDAAE